MSVFAYAPRLLSSPCTTSSSILPRHPFLRSSLLSKVHVTYNVLRLPFCHSRRALRSSTSQYRLAVSISAASELGHEGANGNEVEASTDQGSSNFTSDLKIFVGNVPYTVESAALAGLFSQVGEVEMVEVIYDRATGRHKGFGFVTMSNVEGVQAAVRMFNGYVFEGRPLRVISGSPYRKEDLFIGGDRGKSKSTANRIIVNNLAWDVDDETLMAFFRRHGKVLNANVVYDKESGRSKGFGFVTYSSEEEANRAIDILYGVDFNGRAIRLSTAESKPRQPNAPLESRSNVSE